MLVATLQAQSIDTVNKISMQNAFVPQTLKSSLLLYVDHHFAKDEGKKLRKGREKEDRGSKAGEIIQL